MKKGVKQLAALATFAVALAALTVIPGAAVNATGAFELDGNATSASEPASTPPDDWDRVCHQATGSDCSTTNNTNGATAVAFGSQTVATGTAFTSGGSKDPIDISSWAWTKGIGGLPGKDALLNGFAARYSLPANPGPGVGTCPSTTSTCNVLFFGMDRLDNSGDAQNGFWFFQNPITLLGTGTSGSGSPFSGVHRNGDLLVVSDFSVGGGTSTISVYVWNSACTAAGKPMASCADSNLQLLQTSTAANCATSAASAAFCGIVSFDPTPATNPADDLTPSPWPFTDKSGNASFLPGEFYEGGINLSAFPGLAAECFATSLAESRSSTSTSATLKSFVLQRFAPCTTTISTTAKDGNGNALPAGGLSIGTGSVSVSDSATLTVTGASTWSGNVSFFLCGPIASGTCDGTTNVGTQIGPTQSVTQATTQPLSSIAASVTSAGRYCWRATFTSSTSGVPNAGDDGSGTSPNPECFSVNPVTPTLTTQASGPVLLGNPISDTAALSGTANKPGTPIINPITPGGPAGGTISFTAFGPNSCTTVAFTSSPVSVSGNGTYGPVSFTPSAVGTYTFVASYTGDPPNTNGVPATACSAAPATETVLVTTTSSTTSAQVWLPNDSGTVHSGSGSTLDATPLSGSLSFTLYDGGDCGVTGTGILRPTETFTFSNASSPVTRSTTNSTVTVSASETVSWLVTFTPTAGSNVSSSSRCEVTTLTITN